MTIVIDHSFFVMKEIQISTFKAECLRLLDEVSRTKEGLTVTRHGKPLVVINPVEEHEPRKGFGIAKGTIEIKEDIIEPATDLSDWEVLS
ncbi:MAG: type II toxin-antitoxin system Phd/YefM family antitoxin [Cyanobacteria bacterium P01_G01_bin.19]